MINWSRERHGSGDNTCFSEQCAPKINIAMIRGDVRDFYEREYSSGNGYIYITFPSAVSGGYSQELRDSVKKTLEKWGFTQIEFVEPSDSEKAESHTVVRGVHKSPLVNVALREVPKPQRGIVFSNKFGTVTMTTGFHEDHERHYYGWSHIFKEVTTYYQEIHGEDKEPLMKRVRLSVADVMEEAARNEAIKGKKNALASNIRSKIDEARKHESYGRSYRAEAASLKERYLKEFGEEFVWKGDV
jgi:hypothetical protein